MARVVGERRTYAGVCDPGRRRTRRYGDGALKGETIGIRRATVLHTSANDVHFGTLPSPIDRSALPISCRTWSSVWPTHVRATLPAPTRAHARKGVESVANLDRRQHCLLSSQRRNCSTWVVHHRPAVLPHVAAASARPVWQPQDNRRRHGQPLHALHQWTGPKVCARSLRLRTES